LPVASASAATLPLALPALPTSSFNVNNLCPTLPGFMNLGPTGPMGPLGAHGPLGNANNLPTGCAAYNLGPSGPLGPGGAL
jgi:hypothetical protein